MKKRIGTKLYNTDTAVCILPDLNLYRQNVQTYFILDGWQIKPLDFSEAEAILKERGLLHLTKRKPEKNGGAALHVSPEAADRLASYCRSHNVTQKKVLEEFIATLEA